MIGILSILEDYRVTNMYLFREINLTLAGWKGTPQKKYKNLRRSSLSVDNKDSLQGCMAMQDRPGNLNCRSTRSKGKPICLDIWIPVFEFQQLKYIQ